MNYFFEVVCKWYDQFKIILGCILSYVFDMTVWLLPRPPKTRGNKQTVLLVRTDSIGDFVLWLDAARVFKKIYPPDQFEITLLADQHWADLAEYYPYWDLILKIDKKKFVTNGFYRWKFLRQIYKTNYDIAIHPIFSRIIFMGDAIVRISRASKRIGWELYEDLNSLFLFSLRNALAKPWYTRLVSLDRAKLMELDKNAQFVRALGEKDFKPAIPKLLKIPGKMADGLQSPYFVVVPDALWEGREWPLPYFVEIARRVWVQKKWNIVFMGVNKILGSQLDQMISEIPLINLIGKTGFLDYLGIIQKSQWVIANESSAIHIASASGVPAVSITGGGHWGRFVPYAYGDDEGQKPVVVNQPMDCYGCEWICKFPRKAGPVPCIARISVNQAWSVFLTTSLLSS